MTKKKNEVIISIFKHHYKYYLTFFALSLVSIMIDYIKPLINARIIDLGIGEKNTSILMNSMIILFVISISSWSTMYIATKIGIKYHYIFDKQIKNKIIGYLIYKGNVLKKFNSVGKLDTLIRNDIDLFISFISNNIMNILLSIIKVCISVILVIRIHPFLGIIIIISQLIIIVVKSKFNKRFEKNSIKLRNSYVLVFQRLNEIIYNINQLLLLRADKYMLSQYNCALKESYIVLENNNKTIQLSIFISEILQVVSECFVLGMGGYLIFNGSITLGLIISLIRYSSMFNLSLKEIVSTWTEYYKNKKSIDSVFQILIEIKMFKKNCEKKQQIKVDMIKIENVSFAYDSNKKIFDNVDVKFSKDKINYIVGKSGIGKTTLINLIMGFIIVESGQIRFNDININDLIEEGTINKYISWVPQEPVIFNDTIYNNILLGNNVSIEKLYETCKLCYIYDDIQQLPKGFDTILGDKGNTISVGQKHRLGIARGILQESQIFIIDEGTAGLDFTTEQFIKNNLKKICENRIVIIITHSSNFIVEESNVFEIKDCKIIQRR